MHRGQNLGHNSPEVRLITAGSVAGGGRGRGGAGAARGVAPATSEVAFTATTVAIMLGKTSARTFWYLGICV